MTQVEPVLTAFGFGGGGVLATFACWALPRIMRSHWWLIARHAALARVLVFVPAMGRDGLVHGLKRALLEAVPPPVLRGRRVPARLEVIVPASALGGLAAPGAGLTDDLAVWLTRLAQRRGWVLPDRSGVRVTLTTDEYGIARRPYARTVTRDAPIEQAGDRAQ